MQLKFFRRTFRTIVVISGLLTSPSLYADIFGDTTTPPPTQAPTPTPTANIEPVGTTTPVVLTPATPAVTAPATTTPATTTPATTTPAITTTTTPAVTTAPTGGNGKQTLRQDIKALHEDAKNASLDKQLLQTTEKRFGKDSTQVQAAKLQLQTDLTAKKTDQNAVKTDLKTAVQQEQKAEKPKMKTLEQALTSHHEGKGHHEAVRIVRIIIVEQGHSRRHEHEHEHERAPERRPEHERERFRSSERLTRR